MGSKANDKGPDGAPILSKDEKTLYFSFFKGSNERPFYKNGQPTTREILELMNSSKNGASNIFEIDISDIKASPAGN